MKINKTEAKEFFKTFNDFKKFLESNYRDLNYGSVIINTKLNKIYYKLISDENEDKIIYTRLVRWVRKEMFFGRHSVKEKKYWLVRGFSEIEAEEKLNKFFIIEHNKINKYKFGESSFVLDYEPLCKICNNKLNFKVCKKGKLDSYIRIISCKNSECVTNSKKKNVIRDKHIAFLPLEIINENKEKQKAKNFLCEAYWLIKGFSKDEAKEKISKIQQKNSKLVKNRVGKTRDSLRKKGYSEEEIDDKCLSPSQVKFWVKKGYSELGAIEEVKKNQSYAAKKIDFSKRFTSNSVQFWLNKGYSEEEAIIKRSERQKTFSKEICIKKYGEEEGLRVFTDRQNKWCDSLNKGGNLKIGYSKISQELFYILLETYSFKEKENVFFATHNKEIKLNKKDGGLWMYDFTDKINNKIIEFNGDLFHGNPNKFNSDDSPNPFKKELKAKDIWEKDKEKIKIAEENGYSVLTIWDSEYRWGNKEEIINKCVKFLKTK